MHIRFNKAAIVGTELAYIQEAIDQGQLSGNKSFTKRCHQWLEDQIGCERALLTHSCTAALEMAAILADIRPGDEIIMPSFTFVSSANAFVLRGGVPVFVDIRPDTQNIDPACVEGAITERTKAILVVHYAGVSCDMDAIMDIANQNNLLVIEDSAQSILSTYKGKPLGSIGHLAALSFHETKNVTCGEGGALLINDPILSKRAEIIWEKGTNRGQFFRGEVDKYTWVDIGSSFLPGEISAAFLLAQLEAAEDLTQRRLVRWQTYFDAFEELERQGHLQRPVVPAHSQHNAHLFYLLLEERDDLIAFLRKKDIGAVFHYIPLHSSPAGQVYGTFFGTMSHTDATSRRLIRLPLWPDLSMEAIDRVIAGVLAFFQR